MIRWVAYRLPSGGDVVQACDADAAVSLMLALKAEGCTGVVMGSTLEKASARHADALRICRLCAGGAGTFEHADCPLAVAKLERQLRRAVAARGAA